MLKIKKETLQIIKLVQEGKSLAEAVKVVKEQTEEEND
jgi:hypothetical protein